MCGGYTEQARSGSLLPWSWSVRESCELPDLGVTNQSPPWVLLEEPQASFPTEPPLQRAVVFKSGSHVSQAVLEFTK